MEPEHPPNKQVDTQNFQRKSGGILIVEQDAIFGELLCRFLEKKGYSFKWIDSCQRVLEECHDFNPEAVILGHRDETASSASRVDQIRQMVGEKSLPVLVLGETGGPGPEGVLRLSDPLDWAELGNSLERLTPSKKNKNALLINADRLFNTILAQQFSRAGWRATQVPHVQSAKNQVHQEWPDLVFMETQLGINDILSVINFCPNVPLFLLATRKLKREEEEKLASSNPVIFQPGQYSLKELKEALESRV